MFSRHRLKIMIVVSLAIIALFFISGLPYGLQTWINSVLAQQYGRPPAFVPRGAGGGNPPAALINCSEPLRDSPGGAVVVKDGTVLHLTPGATWLTVGNPVADQCHASDGAGAGGGV